MAGVLSSSSSHGNAMKSNPNLGHTRSLNDFLPNELISLTFEYLFYDSEEEFELGEPTPIDTLLLVCKRWYNIALTNTLLWSRIEIFVKDVLEIDSWTSYAASRIRRSGSSQLLDVTFETAWNLGFPKDKVAHYAAAEVLLQTLSGPYGETSTRWKSVTVNVTRGFAMADSISKLLSFPTPHLEALSVSGFYDVSGPITLPNPPSLRLLNLTFCRLNRFPNTRAVTHMELATDDITFWDVGAIAEAGLLQSLSLDCWHEYALLPARYPFLRSLHLRGRVGSRSIIDISAPNLEELTLQVDDSEGYSNVIQCPGLDLRRLRYAHIGWPHRIDNASIELYLQPVREFLNLATGLRTLELEHRPMATLVFKLLTTHCRHLFQEHTLILQLDEEAVELGHGEKRLESLDDLRVRAECEPLGDATWEDIYRELASCLEF
ncbi:hypothetical protein FRC19_008407 [Serendipita sp. 401]|nr:hypothetical protein FRC19_008407 [Serendipita sp. 401]KAG9058783.1 hypothetical protein FS842_003572 [Serendipita sp. 407]